MDGCHFFLTLFFSTRRLELGSECYCGNGINTASGAVQQDCPLQGLMACSANAKQLCGGPSLMTYYHSETL
jgi:hypothetical protein